MVNDKFVPQPLETQWTAERILASRAGTPPPGELVVWTAEWPFSLNQHLKRRLFNSSVPWSIARGSGTPPSPGFLPVAPLALLSLPWLLRLLLLCPRAWASALSPDLWASVSTGGLSACLLFMFSPWGTHLSLALDDTVCRGLPNFCLQPFLSLWVTELYIHQSPWVFHLDV